MKSPTISYANLVAHYLAPNGWEVITPQPQDFWNQHNRIYVRRGDYSFPLQYKDSYNYLQVYHLLNDLEITIPEEIKQWYDGQKAVWEAKKGTSINPTAAATADDPPLDHPEEEKY
jgi:hypothetical protein